MSLADEVKRLEEELEQLRQENEGWRECFTALEEIERVVKAVIAFKNHQQDPTERGAKDE